MPHAQSLAKTQSRKSRSAILKVAERLFAQQGFQCTTLRQIAAKSGANGALVSYYFGGKEGLWDAVLEDKLKTLQKILSPMAQKTGKITLSELQELVRGLFRYVREDQSFHLLAQRTLLEEPAQKKRIAANLWLPFHLQLTELVRRASGGKLSAEEATLRAHVISGLVQKYGNMLCFYYDEISEIQNPDALLASLENYVIESLLPQICAAEILHS